MLVEHLMRKAVVSIDLCASIQDAICLMKEKHIRTLPVVQNEKLVGIITERMLKSAMTSVKTAPTDHEILFVLDIVMIKDVMAKNPISVPVNFTAKKTANVLLNNNINSVPVVDRKNAVVGMVARTDLFKTLTVPVDHQEVSAVIER